MQALGLIETRGLLTAIECADVMLKTAQVELVERTFVGGGLVTITVTGDVGAVKAAVEAGVSAVEKLNHLSLVSRHIIPRPHPGIESMFTGRANPPMEQSLSVTPVLEQSKGDAQVIEDTATEATEPVTIEATEQVTTEQTEHAPNESTKPVQVLLNPICKAELDALAKQFGLESCLDVLKTLPVVKLRNLAREYTDLGLAGRAISKANRELLIRNLKEYYERGSEK